MSLDRDNYSNGEYKRLSDRIRKCDSINNIFEEDLRMLQHLRTTYKEPLAIIFGYLCKISHKINKESICTFRIKRIESIFSKLQRQPQMEVQRMADIAGCRCIVPTTEDVFRIFELFKKREKKLPFSIGEPKDYIREPKLNGYKSLHFNVKLKRKSNKKIEIQIRSIQQHNWATLVEITDVLFKSKLKEYNDKFNPELYEFHKLLSKQDNEMTITDKRRITNISGKYRYLEKVGNVFNQNSVDLRTQRNKLKVSQKSYFLLSTNSEGKTDIQVFGNYKEAEQEYFNMFSNNPNKKNIVLANLKNATFNKLSIAYSNYFLTYNDTLLRILKIISDVNIYAYNHFYFSEFRKGYKAFLFIMKTWFGEKNKEVSVLTEDANVKRSPKKKKEWIESINSRCYEVKEINNQMQKGFRFFPFFYCIMKIYKNKIEQELFSTNS